MKTINETFEDWEFEALQEAKGEQSWRDFIMKLAKRVLTKKEVVEGDRSKSK